MIAGSFVSVFGANLAIAAIDRGWDGTSVSIGVALAAWLARACTMGVLISDRGITLRSWFRTRTYTFDRVRGYDAARYSGILNGFGVSLDPFFPRLRMLTLRVGERWKEFPSTICSRPTAKRLRDEIGGRLRADDVARE
ncbi:hypothetical protein [Curtobacterium sp. HSID17257]|uniref:hypothetical protein n=1 Tax=Curtobacterium sp. HSID17257 TaxID=2419510 RepID=UPI000F86771F|nr:hypothetical protein [Curtobacterium sp. HSID17257]RUQ10141.1 hypothetical protein D8M35_00595 [Curtobacterium sp. HSID17257]